jgi:hypothetical protein
MQIKTLSVLFTAMLSVTTAFAGDDVINGTLAGGALTDQGGNFHLVFDGVKTLQYAWNGVDLTGLAMSSTAVLEKQ